MKLPGKWWPLVALAVVVATVGGFAVAGSAADRDPLSRDAAVKLEREIARAGVEKHGIYLVLTTVERRSGAWCVVVDMLNPTAPNRRWLRDRFGRGVCPSPKPAGGLIQADVICRPGDGEEVAVPDVVGLSPFAAARKLKAVGLRVGCTPGGGYDKPPSRYSFMNSVVVERMCEATGRVGGSVSLRLVGMLPGGYRFVARSCADPLPGVDPVVNP